MDFTQRMTALLGGFRRDRNGAEADAMRLVGRPYGLNYGVSLSDVRSAARAETPDYAFSRYLFLQDVRELRLSAFHIADPAQLTRSEFAFWAAGITNSELASEGAFALLSRADAFPELFAEWIVGDDPLLVYAALMAAARCASLRGCDESLCALWVDAAAESLRRIGVSTERSARLVCEGGVAMLAAVGLQSGENRLSVLHAADSLASLPWGGFILGELAWRLAR